MSTRKIFYELSWAIGFLCLLALLKASVLSLCLISSESMEPQVIPGDRIFTNKLAYGLWLPFANQALFSWTEPQRGDVILFHVATKEGTYIKRVIGLPGDVISFQEGVLLLNGEQMKEPYAVLSPSLEKTFFESRRFVVPPHAVFVLGDNRDYSEDSRDFGFVKESFIYGKAKFIAFSTRGEEGYLPAFRQGRFFKGLH